jgi:DUF1009 family protein
MSKLNHGTAIGLIAGWGRFPVVVASKLKQHGFPVVCCAIHGHADPCLREFCDHIRYFGMGRLGAQVRFFQKHGVAQVTMAGKIFKTLLFRKFRILRHLPDLTFWRHFYPVYLTRTKDQCDDTLLSIVTRLFESNDIQVKPATDFAPDLLVRKGLLTKRQPNSSQLLDIEFAWRIAKEMGRLDIGQSVAVKGRAVLAVEALEGTDECIRRAGQLCPSGGFVVAKVAKPRQDMRFDVPTIGLDTIQTLHESGGSVLAVEAGKTIILDEEELIQRANKYKIAIVAIESHNVSSSSLNATEVA